VHQHERAHEDGDRPAAALPTPFHRDITAAAQAAGLEPAFVFGLIRQETRFMPQLRSHVGAAGLMQIMPATAKWTARKSGLAYNADQIADPQVNLRLGTFYLKLVLDSFGNSAPMAAAAYNAGPARPRRWRGGLMLDPAVWTENVPFYETRDYVKKVMTNAAVYAALQGGTAPRVAPRGWARRSARGTPSSRRRRSREGLRGRRRGARRPARRAGQRSRLGRDRRQPAADAGRRFRARRARLPGVPASAHARGVRAGAHRAQDGAGLPRLRFHAAPDVTLEDDLQRRDLTINAIAQDADGTLVDPYGGRATSSSACCATSRRPSRRIPCASCAWRASPRAGPTSPSPPRRSC
jgi:hypothetical protein